MHSGLLSLVCLKGTRTSGYTSYTKGQLGVRWSGCASHPRTSRLPPSVLWVRRSRVRNQWNVVPLTIIVLQIAA